MLTELEAWEKMERWWVESKEIGESDQYAVMLSSTSRAYGLCACIIHLFGTAEIHWRTFSSMNRRVNKHRYEIGRIHKAFLWSLDKIGKEDRIKFCRLQVSKLASCSSEKK